MFRQLKPFTHICLLLLIPFSCSRENPPGDPPAGDRDITTVTYNIHYCARGVDSVNTTLNAINADIIALQEVPVINGIPASEPVAQKKGYHHRSSAPYAFSNNFHWVLSFISKNRILDYDEKPLGNGRKAFRITFSHKGCTLQAVTFHLSPFVWVSTGLLKANLARSGLRQGELATLLQFIRKKPYPAILLGDFNSLPFMNERNVLSDNGFKELYDSLGKKHDGTFLLDPSMFNAIRAAAQGFPISRELTLDYMYTTAELKPLQAEVLPFKTSDHFPLMGVYSIVSCR